MRITVCAAFLCALVAAAGAGERRARSFEGTVLAYRSSMVNARAVGNIAEILVEEGQAVGEGQILARLDDAVARAQYEGALLQSSDTSLVRLAELQVAQARRELDTATDLAGKNAGSPNDKIKAQNNYDQALANLDYRKAELEQFRAAAKLRAAALEEYCVRAPFKGIVAATLTHVGESTYPTDKRLFQVIDASKVYVTVPVDVTYMSKLKVGQKASITCDACPGKTFEGEISFLSPSAEPGGALFVTKVLADNREGLLKPEMAARVTFAGVLEDAHPAGGEARQDG